MGTDAAVQLVGGDQASLARARMLVEELEQRWSRFRTDSELAAVNAASGRAVLVSAATAALVHEAVSWWAETGGRFDPTVLPALVDAGYAASFDTGTGPIGDGQPVPGCAGVAVDLRTSAVRTPVGVALDLGGIGKGAAVDRLVEHLSPTATGGLVDLGGDLRVWGTPPRDDGWPIALEDPRDGSRAELLWLAEGAVATSTSLRRRWTDGRRAAHHLIDPRTGRPAAGERVGVAVVAGRATAADVLAKAALVAGSVDAASGLLHDHGVAGLLTPAEGATVAVGPLPSFRYLEVGS